MDSNLLSAKRMENIYINDFAGLKDVSIDIAPITVFIGPQASGKSVTAKLIFFFREIGFQIPIAAQAGTTIEGFKAETKKKFSRYFPPDSWPQRNFTIVYKNNRQEIRIEYQATDGKLPEESLNLIWTEFYAHAIKHFGERWSQLLKEAPEGDVEKAEGARRQFRDELYAATDKNLGQWSKFQQIFIPAGRAFLSQLETSIFTAITSAQEAGQNLDPFLIAFGSFYQESKQVLYEKRTRKGTSKDTGPLGFQKTISEILGGDFKRVERRDYLHYSDGRQVRLAQASSGQQEALPLLLVLGRFYSLSHATGRSVYIEEPEAHLFPGTQRKIIESMARIFRNRESQMCLCMTTHSPYILTSLNNLIQAGIEYEKADAEKRKRINAIVSEEISLKPSHVAVYALQNGASSSIMCKETKLIDAELIDKVSEDIAVNFDRLLETRC